MADDIFPLDRRELLAGLGAAILTTAPPRTVTAQPGQSLSLLAKPGVAALRSGAVDTPIWSLLALSPASLRFRRSEQLEVALDNGLPAPVAMNWLGIGGVPAAEPLATRAALAPGARETVTIPLRHAGTFLCDLHLLGDGQARPSRALPLIVEESEPVAVDRDEVFLLEDWRLRPDGTAMAPGIDAKDATPLFTVNGLTTLDILALPNQRLRLRFINGCQRAIIAVKIDNHDVRIMALDSQPVEPFLARGGAIVLAPGTRVDAFIDATAAPGSASAILLHDGREARPIARLVTSGEAPIRDAPLPAPAPLPSNGLPDRLDLKGAQRFDLALGGPPADWVPPANFAGSAAPAFRAKAGRTVVLALTNRAESAATFHLHGHHFRLLDRLDDGWKPFWLDTLAIDPGQTQRIAFLAEYAGRWLLEAFESNWAAPRLVRWYSVE